MVFTAHSREQLIQQADHAVVLTPQTRATLLLESLLNQAKQPFFAMAVLAPLTLQTGNQRDQLILAD